MHKVTAVLVSVVLALTLSACGTKAKPKKSTNIKPPTTNSSVAGATSKLKEGDKCKKLNASAVAANGRKLMCKRTTRTSSLRWRYV